MVGRKRRRRRKEIRVGQETGRIEKIGVKVRRRRIKVENESIFIS